MMYGIMCVMVGSWLLMMDHRFDGRAMAFDDVAMDVMVGP